MAVDFQQNMQPHIPPSLKEPQVLHLSIMFQFWLNLSSNYRYLARRPVRPVCISCITLDAYIVKLETGDKIETTLLFMPDTFLL